MLRVVSRFAKIAAIVVLATASALATFDVADARRAGSSGFGSRGTRTFDTPATTRTAPTQAAPIDRTMTPRPQQPQTTTQPPIGGQQRPGFFGGFGGSMIGGLIAGGLLGMLLGHGFGGGMGFLGMLLQIGLIVLLISFAMRFFANRQRTQYAAPGTGQSHNTNPMNNAGASPRPSFSIPTIGGGTAAAHKTRQASDEIGLQQADLDRFERLLTEVQTAYGKEDYATLRRLTTPEAMSYLAEELGENATNGVRNSVSDVRLLQGDTAEAWREDNAEYATLAMRYSSIDAMLDRTTGKLVDGDDRNPSETVELWTFVRKPGADWILSAIQGTESRHG
ncbi:Putative import inner membrane translocase protein, TIM family [Rhizobium freirei PRF 81]|uniref:Putative import inner membrane translocase protein, TIM family n=1 Tax=Rhizobium freirei PRF 81 TaxID=363754 RepID=N6V4G7_9HYPH|nr:Tim44 domain-containing protein [Rhizobium freirei]ENN88780.1 Putative import inner membrane translocase protein, TIM family [Rhizobium freirei PRF 81]